jgi:uncharacterized protein (UPF0332 family)
MDPQRQQTLWAIAVENYQAAVLTAQQGWHNVSVGCSYYAVFTAMWVALGEPSSKGYWEHRGISKPFALGHWRTPSSPLDRELIKAIRQLYEDRLGADYKAVQLTPLESTAGLRTAQRVLHLVADACQLSLEGTRV